MLTSTLLFAANDALGKVLLQTYAVAILLAIRSAGALAVLIPMIWRAGGPAAIWPRSHHGWHLLRVLLVVGEVGCSYWAIRVMPLADVFAIYLAAPLLVAALSPVLLGERVDARQWLLICLGFVGVVVIVRPGAGVVSLPALVALAGAVCFAMMMVVTRRLRRSSGLSLITTQTMAVGLAGLVGVPFVAQPVALVDTGLIALIGVVAMAAHAAANQALRLAPAALVAPLQYSLVIWGMLFGVFVFGDMPTLRTLVGAGLITVTGVLVMRRRR